MLVTGRRKNSDEPDIRVKLSLEVTLIASFIGKPGLVMGPTQPPGNQEVPLPGPAGKSWT